MDYLYFKYIDMFQHWNLTELGVISWYLVPFCIIAAFLILAILILVLAERKILALFTQRKGPNRVGFHGCMQTVADAIKLLFKEDIVPYKSDKFLHCLAPLIVFTPVMTVWFLIPYARQFNVINSSVDIILYFALMAFPVLGVLLAGYASNNKYSLLGGIRSIVLTISYELPLFVCLVSIIVLSGSCNLHSIVLSQSKNIFSWYFIPSFVGLIIFFICAIAELNRVPFDMSEAESELVGGYNTEYSGMKFALFFLAEYASMFIMSAFIATLFFGGFSSPFGKYLGGVLPIDFLSKNIFIFVEQIFWIIFKTVCILFTIIWVRATLPRFRVDKLLNFAWKFLFPVSILNLFIVCVIKYFKGC